MRTALLLACAAMLACGDNRPPPPAAACTAAVDCGADSECLTRTCIDHTCGSQLAAAGVVVVAQVAGDCQVVECDGNGGTMMLADDGDPPDDGNPCTTEACANGVVEHGDTAIGTVCGSGLQCDGHGDCVSCNVPADCPGTDSDCAVRTCVQGACGIEDLPAGSVVAQQTAGDCQTIVCDGAGQTSSTVDDSDRPDDHNECTQDVCTNGVPSNPDLAAGASCGTGLLCDGNGACVGCLSPTDCPGSDTECETRTCVAQTCGLAFASAGTLLAAGDQTAGDCKDAVCDGSGGVTFAIDGGDVPDDHETCTLDVCTGSSPSNPPVADNTSCSEGGGNVCNGLGQCVFCVAVDDGNPCTIDGCTAGLPSHLNVAGGTSCGTNGETCQVEGSDPTSRCQPGFYVVRVGTGATMLGVNAVDVFLDHYTIGGALVRTIALPTTASASAAACTLTGTKVGEGSLARSGDGRFVTLGCYDAAPGTTDVSTTPSATVRRVAARIDAAGVIDTSTRFATAFSTATINDVVTNDGNELWAGGGNTTTEGGVWFTNHGASSGEVQLVANPPKERALAIASGGLFATSGVAPGVFEIGAGLPTAAGQSTTGLPNMESTNLFGFVFLGPDTLYTADSAAPALGGGIQKWTFDGANWTHQTTFNNGLSVGLQSLDAYRSGSVIVLVATTWAFQTSAVVTLVDDGTANPAFTTVTAAPANTQYRGAAIVPRN